MYSYYSLASKFSSSLEMFKARASQADKE